MAINSQLSNSQLPTPGVNQPARSDHWSLGRWLAWVLGVGSLLVGAAGCAKARAATVPDGPPLAMPQPPPRLFGPLVAEPLPAEPVVVEAPTTEAPRVAPPPPARRTAAPPVPEKPEAAPPPIPQPVPELPRELRAASSVADAEVDRKVRALLILAARDLGQVDYRRLTAAGREQYDQAKAFSEQAEKALTERNYVFAETLADKAAKLATELLGR